MNSNSNENVKHESISSPESCSTNSNLSWAQNLPHQQALYHPDNEKDSCGVGFICNIKAVEDHSIVSDASTILCNMVHRGGGKDIDDGDGAGVMTGIPHEFFTQYFKSQNINYSLVRGQYATGNLFFHITETVRNQSIKIFEETAEKFGLKILHWRTVPVNNSVIGVVSKSKEPVILQPFVVLDQNMHATFDAKLFNRQLYLLRKQATHAITLKNWFYICSLSATTIIYKGQLSPPQVYTYFMDLLNEEYKSHFALVHSRFSTNTFPSWDRAQPMRWCAHNGEINTLQGNKNWMRAREGVLSSINFKEELNLVYPTIESGGSDSAAFDNVLELLVINGVVSLPEAVMMMIPEAWQNQTSMSQQKKAFYEWAACLMEPWDGPALFTFSDGRYIGASLDRNGLRPCRFYITENDRMICASEVGTIFVDPKTIVKKGRLQPGKMLLVDTLEGRVVGDKELKDKICSEKPFGKWIEDNLITMTQVREHFFKKNSGFIGNFLDTTKIHEDKRMLVFGFNFECLNMIIVPMAVDGKEALGSMGTDIPLACLAHKPRLIYDYFRQLFAQVTNPPIDPVRESIVMSLTCYVGPQGNILNMDAAHCDRLRLPSTILDISDLRALQEMNSKFPKWTVAEIDITYPVDEGVEGYVSALDRVIAEVVGAIQNGDRIAILSDRAVSVDRVPLSSLIVGAGLHQYLVDNKLRSKIAIVMETGEAKEVHHFCVLLGYGVDAICPYLAFEAIMKLRRDGLLKKNLTKKEIVDNYRAAADNGIKKVMSKMGISTLQSYKGAQIFEALGLGESVIGKCFSGTRSRIKGVGFDVLAKDALEFHRQAYPTRNMTHGDILPETGEYHWREGGEHHINEPVSIANLQDAVRRKNDNAYEAYSKQSFESIKNCTLRGLLEFKKSEVKAIPIEEVEPWTSIVKRFVTGAMSYGSISLESHSTLAIAMNQLGGKSNTGEGGEDSARSTPLENGDSMRSAIKQVASGRFGVTSYYLSDANELQIKMAQGAKPGEGGELPGKKVSEGIAKTRKSTPGVGLISPPPHHDIYSIEDLKQLIYDCKCANPEARVSVKLVSEVGVGVIASGVAKAKADHILISGHDGGTGASRWTGIRYAGLPWELGLAETHQTLVLNDLRGRVIVQTDGQIKTGRDVVVSCLLGAEEWGFATAPLIAMGCTMMRKCHLNTCPVGIATQDPELRKKFEGKPEHVVNFFYYVAEEVRQIMATLGFRTINEMIGRADLLEVDNDRLSAKTTTLDLTPILTPAFTLRKNAATFNTSKQDHLLEKRVDNYMIELAKASIADSTKKSHIDIEIVNTDRAFGTTLSYEVSKKYKEEGLPEDTITIKAKGSAGQSLGAFLAKGISIELEGDANDYVGKGLSGGKIVVYKPKESLFNSEQNVIVGNVCFYGATSGKAFISGIAAERFCVRNSGVVAVVEGLGDHGCEYMTGGAVIVLGKVGRNFAAGMSGGYAYVLDLEKTFYPHCNQEMVDLEDVQSAEDIEFLKTTIEDHVKYTGSEIGQKILKDFKNYLPKFVKVFPQDFKAVLKERKLELQQQQLQQLVTASKNSQDSKSNPTTESQDESAEEASISSPVRQTIPVASSVLDIEDAMGDFITPDPNETTVLDKLRGFSKYKRKGDVYRSAGHRVKDWKEVNNRLPPAETKVQAARCMDCGVAFCQSDNGCPISNIIPKWNDLVFNDQWKEALNRLLLTNNFPEFTGRVCPAPCEGACVLGINELPVSIKSIECAIIDKGFEKGWMVPYIPKHRTGKKVAIIGSGPSGLAAADQLNKAGHWVTVYDRNDRHGGLLMYGIPNMKLDKSIVQRRIDFMKAEGVKFLNNAEVGKNVDANTLRSKNDALLLCTGATWPRDLRIPNRELDGIHFAMEFLQRNTKSLLDSGLKDETYLSAQDKNVIIIGGGDTGTDCCATALRHGAKSITNFEIMPTPSKVRGVENPWPQYPRVMRLDYGHEEVKQVYGKDPRQYSILSKEFVSDGKGNVKGIKVVTVEWNKDERGQFKMTEVPNSEKFYEADLILLAMGFLGPENEILKQLGVTQNQRSNIETPKGKFSTNLQGVFAAGDCRRGQSLIVWGINEGREAARNIDVYLMGSSVLPAKGGIYERDVEGVNRTVKLKFLKKINFNYLLNEKENFVFFSGAIEFNLLNNLYTLIDNGFQPSAEDFRIACIKNNRVEILRTLIFLNSSLLKNRVQVSKINQDLKYKISFKNFKLLFVYFNSNQYSNSERPALFQEEFDFKQYIILKQNKKVQFLNGTFDIDLQVIQFQNRITIQSRFEDLFIAVKEKNCKLVYYFLCEGLIDPSLQNNKAIMFAFQKRYWDIVKALFIDERVYQNLSWYFRGVLSKKFI
ncbi:glutamate synthase [NADH] [Lobulomyces angularis]|nr:glutamate synthase [NADH] [Lobulomyces angularis]